MAAVAMAAGTLPGGPASARQAALLASPGAYSFAPVPPAPSAAGPGGVASVGFGSRGTQGSSIELQSGLLGGSGTRAFVALGQAQELGHADHVPRFSSQGGAIGIETQLPAGFSVGLSGGWQRDRQSYAVPGP